MREKMIKRSFAILGMAMLLGLLVFAGAGEIYAAEATERAAAKETAESVTEEQATDSAKTGRAVAAAVAIGLAALPAALAMGMSISKSNDGIARQPEAAGEIRTNLMLGLVFIETVVIYALIVAILIIFVL